MSRRLVIVLVLVAVALGSAAWWRLSPRNGSSVAQGRSGTSGQSAQKTPPAEPPGPSVSLSINESAIADVVPGFPIIFVADIQHPAAGDPSAVAMTISAGTGRWTDWLKVEIRDAQRKPVMWPLTLVTQSPGALALDRENVGRIGWTLSPEMSGTLPEGVYDVRVVLDTRTAADGWKGQQSSTPAVVRVVKSPGALSAGREEERAMLLAGFHQLTGDDRQAMADVDALLATQPHSIDALTMKGDLLAKGGHSDAALTAYDDALTLAYATEGKQTEQPAGLLRRRRSLLTAAIAAGR
jgi:hypothetical protein